MKNASTLLKKYIKTGGALYAYAVVTLATGEQLILTSDKDFMVSTNSYTEQGGSDGFPLGVAVSKTITLTIDNIDERYSEYDFYYARIALYTEADIDYQTLRDIQNDIIKDTENDPILTFEPHIERMQEGVFTVLDPVAIGDVIELTAYDDMWKSDRAFESKLTYPATARQLFIEVGRACGIPIGSATFENQDFVIDGAPENLTGRQVIGYIAQIACGNAVIQNGTLVIKSYDFSALDGIDDDTTPEELEEDAGYHVIQDYSSDPDIDTDNVVITGVSTTRGSGESEEVVIYGKDTYCIKITNPLIANKEQTAVSYIGKKLVGVTLRKFSGEFFPNPTIEFMDLACLVDRKDKVYRTLITTHEFAFLGASSLSCDINSPERQAGEYYSNAAEIYYAQKKIDRNKSEFETAVGNLQESLANSSGMYTTEEVQPDGSTISYIHDKATLAESKNVIKVTAESIGISNDGGVTYPYGVFLTGDLIARILYTVGINADYINTGTFTVKDKNGNITFQADTETGVVSARTSYFTVEGKSVAEIAQEEAQNVQNDLDTFKDLVNGSFRDGVISESEAQALQQSLSELEKDNESMHKQYSAVKDSVSLTKTSGSNLTITFSEDCATEVSSGGTKYDYLGLYYKKDDVIYKALTVQSGADLAGNTFIVPSTDVYISWYSDSSNSNYYGFSITDMKPTTTAATVTGEIGALPSYEMIEAATPIVIATPHPYENSMRKLWHYKARTVTKAVLTSKMNAYTSAYNDLADAIGAVIEAKEVTADDKEQIDSLFEDYNTAFSALNETLEEVRRDISATAASGAAEYGNAVLKITQDEIQLKVTADEVESLIDQKADSIRLKADKIAWESTYSSMSESGILKCTSAELKGTMKCGSDSGYWVQLASGGRLTGGYGNNQYGYIDYSATVKNSTTGITYNGIQIQGGCLRISVNELSTRSSSNVANTAYAGATGRMTYISSITARSDGGINWVETTVNFENGLLVSSL